MRTKHVLWHSNLYRLEKGKGPVKKNGKVLAHEEGRNLRPNVPDTRQRILSRAAKMYLKG